MRAAALAMSGLSAAFGLIAGAFGLLDRDAAASIGIPAVEPTYLSGFVMTLLGLLIVWRHPTHLVAWLYIASGVSGEMLGAFRSYGLYGTTTDPGSLPGAGLLSWVASWGFIFPASCIFFTLLLFPNGRILGPRWWVVVALIVTGLGLIGAGFALGRDDPRSVTPFRSPLSVQELEGLVRAGAALLSAGLVGVGASLVLRYRLARADEQLQLKWVVYASCAAVVMTLFAVFLLTREEPLRSLFRPFALSPALIPIAAAIAILRYRLYDIDLLINRTLVYGATSAAIAATFYVGLVALQPLLRTLISGSEIAVAASTLLSFALLQPIRRRVQDAVDRRFDRSRYDAARTLDLFADRLRDEVDLDALRSDLLVAVAGTMAPAHASLWLRKHLR